MAEILNKIVDTAIGSLTLAHAKDPIATSDFGTNIVAVAVPPAARNQLVQDLRPEMERFRNSVRSSVQSGNTNISVLANTAPLVAFATSLYNNHGNVTVFVISSLGVALWGTAAVLTLIANASDGFNSGAPNQDQSINLGLYQTSKAFASCVTVLIGVQQALFQPSNSTSA